MRDTVFLIVSRKGMLRMNKTLPQLSKAERAISIEVVVPDSAFDEVVPKARLEITDDNLIRPVIELTVQEDSVAEGVTGR